MSIHQAQNKHGIFVTRRISFDDGEWMLERESGTETLGMRAHTLGQTVLNPWKAPATPGSQEQTGQWTRLWSAREHTEFRAGAVLVTT